MPSETAKQCNARVRNYIKQMEQKSNEIFQGCLNLAIVMVCGALDTNGKLYASGGYGLGMPGFSLSVTNTGRTRPSKVETGKSATVEGNLIVGGGVTFSPATKAPLPLFEVGTPGYGFFVMNGVKLN